MNKKIVPFDFNSCDPDPHKRAVEKWQNIARILLFLLIVFIFYGSLIPFSFEAKSKPFVIRSVSRMDVLSNILLYMAFGFFFMVAFVKREKKKLSVFVLTILAGAFLSCIIEYLQCYSPERVSSVVDLFVNIVGTILGAMTGGLFVFLFQDEITDFFSRVWVSFPLAAALIIVACVIVLDGLLPLDISIQVSDIWHSVKNICFTYSWETFFKPEIALYLLFGFVLCFCLYQYRKFSRMQSLLLVALASGLLSGVVECAQLSIVSRVSDFGDVVYAAVGGFIGGVFLLYYIQKKSVLILGLYCIFLFFVFVIPFSYDQFMQVSWKSFMPFYAYFVRTNLFALQDLYRTIILFVPLGFLLSEIVKEKRIGAVGVFFIGTCICCFLECTQIINADRHFDVTDILSGIVGIWMGWYFWKIFKKYGVFSKNT